MWSGGVLKLLESCCVILYSGCDVYSVGCWCGECCVVVVLRVRCKDFCGICVFWEIMFSRTSERCCAV